MCGARRGTRHEWASAVLEADRPSATAPPSPLEDPNGTSSRSVEVRSIGVLQIVVEHEGEVDGNSLLSAGGGEARPGAGFSSDLIVLAAWSLNPDAQGCAHLLVEHELLLEVFTFRGRPRSTIEPIHSAIDHACSTRQAWTEEDRGSTCPPMRWRNGANQILKKWLSYLDRAGTRLSLVGPFSAPPTN